MSITTYTELKTAIGTWAHRSDLSTVASDFVTLAEARIMRDIIKAGGLRILESSVTLTPSAGACALPSDFLGIRSLVLSSSPNLAVEAAPMDQFKRYAVSDGRVYCVSGSNILLSPDADDYDLILYYFATPTALSDSNASNNLFALAPDLYLFGCLIESAVYSKADPSAWVSSYQTALSALLGQDTMQKWGNNLRVRAA